MDEQDWGVMEQPRRRASEVGKGKAKVNREDGERRGGKYLE